MSQKLGSLARKLPEGELDIFKKFFDTQDILEQ
jgi:hypothetical protein